jgi:hypothetical protein
MKKLLIFLLFMAYFTSGCSFRVEVLTPASPQPSLTDITEVTQSIETPPAAISPIPTTVPVGFTPVTSEPVFFNAFVSTDRNSVTGTSAFPAGTKQIFAHWNYQNMREGLIIKREWFLDGQLWLVRDEPWDIAKYGTSGVLQDISIYDYDLGLPVGTYRLVVLINDVAQPIGIYVSESSPEVFLEFEILPPIESTSPNGQWKAISLLDRAVVIDANGNQSDLVTGREIVSIIWLDDRHLLFVDRDRSGQVFDLLVGVRDTLWFIDITSRESWPLYTSETALGSRGGLYPSPDGKYIAGIEGSGFGDACFLDAKTIFFEMEDGYKNVKVTKQDQFTGIPVLTDQVLYPTAVGTWKSNTQYSVYLDKTCATDGSLSGFYLFDLLNKNAILEPTSSTPLNVGDLGWGDVHGFVTDAVTGNAIPNATVTCQHSSYTSPSSCTGLVITSAVGLFLFERVFFHDTDTIKLTVTASGYESQEYTQSSFTGNDMFVSFSLKPLP